MNNTVKFVIALLAFILPGTWLLAQSFPRWGGTMTGIADSNGNQFGTSNAFPVNVAPSAGNVTSTAVTCAATSTALGVTGASYLSVLIPLSGQNVCFGWGNAAATLSPPSQCFSPGTLVAWGGGTGSCIVASSTQAVTVNTR